MHELRTKNSFHRLGYRHKEWGPDLADRFTPNTPRRRYGLIIINIAIAVRIAFAVVTRPLPKSFVDIKLSRARINDTFTSAVTLSRRRAGVSLPWIKRVKIIIERMDGGFVESRFKF